MFKSFFNKYIKKIVHALIYFFTSLLSLPLVCNKRMCYLKRNVTVLMMDIHCVQAMLSWLCKNVRLLLQVRILKFKNYYVPKKKKKWKWIMPIINIYGGGDLGNDLITHYFVKKICRLHVKNWRMCPKVGNYI